MLLIHQTAHIFENIKLYLAAIDAEKYTQPLEVFSDSTIGQHTRHIVEFFQCLVEQCQCSQIIDYDKRQRNKRIETDPTYTIQVLEDLLQKIEKQPLEQMLYLEVDYCENHAADTIPTSFKRELVYTIEHAIHHLAMVKIGLKILMPTFILPSDFGVASSTIKHRKHVHSQLSANG
ncbi:MAG: DinB family protein [Chitinophagales bacterium]